MTETAAARPSPTSSQHRRTPLTRHPLTAMTVSWLAAYIITRTVLVLTPTSMPLSAVGSDLIVVTGWGSVVLPVLALTAVAVQAVLVGRRPGVALRWSAVVAGALTAAALMVSAALILLDLVGGILPGLGVEFFPLGALSRSTCVAAAVLTGAHTRRFWSATRNRAAPRHRMTRMPAWVVAVGYAAVACCLTRLGAQLVVGMDATPFPLGPAAILFEIGFLLAGTLLPLALVHRWGRIWPGWVPWLRGRPVPRMLLIVCGGLLGIPMVAYFGMMTAQMVVERLQGRNPFPPTDGLGLPEAFFWVSVPAYLVWGIALVIGAIAYARITAPERASTEG